VLEAESKTAVSSAVQRNTVEPFILIILGATGDLTRRKLLPAVYSLFREGLLPDGTCIVGFARRDKNDDIFRREMHQAVQQFARVRPIDEDAWSRFARNLFYHRSTFDDPAGFRSLRDRLAALATERQIPPNYLFYLATQPTFFGHLLKMLHGAGVARYGTDASPWTRIIIEKPFGHDLESARELNRIAAEAFTENQIFRIDHYLGKETVQNILVFRFANSIFEPIWNQKYVDHVQITVSETIGVGARGRYYDAIGALRDMVQNHMMHLLCLVAMEPPNALEAHAVRDEKVKLLKALRIIPHECVGECVVRGQYAAGTCNGEPVPGYREEEGVAPDSTVETFVALKVFIDNWRWAGVPFYLRTGKRLPAKITEISVHFKPVPQILFNKDPAKPLRHNILALRIQPNEGISLRFEVKSPGVAMDIRSFKMDFDYASAFGKEPPDAYERLLLDAAVGDATLFTRSDEVEAAWEFITPILDTWAEQSATGIPTYPAGTWGPEEADRLIRADGREWYFTMRKQRERND